MVSVAQLVRVVDCGSIGRGFESHRSPKPDKYGKVKKRYLKKYRFFVYIRFVVLVKSFTTTIPK